MSFPALQNLVLQTIPRPGKAVPLILREVGGKNRVCVLAHTDAPDWRTPVEFGGSVRSETTYYPGSPVPTSQILGPEEGMLRFAGTLDDMRSGGPPGRSMALARLIDSMRRESRPVSVEYGVLFWRCTWQTAEFLFPRHDHIPYRIELQVVDDGEGRGLRVLTGALGIPVTDGLGDLLDGIDRALGGLPT